MHEHILAPALRRNEAVSLSRVEPLHGTSCHNHSPLFTLRPNHHTAERRHRIIQEAEAAAIATGEAAERARTRALDPTLLAADVATARHEMDSAAFRRDRLQAAVTKLGVRLRELRAEE